MGLSLEVKGVIADYAAKILSHEKIENFAMKVGVNPENFQASWSKRKKALFILDKISETHTEVVLRAIIKSSKSGTWDEDFSEEVIKEINFVMEKTMNARVSKDGEILPIFDPTFKLDEKQSYIERKLKEFGFSDSSSHYKEAVNTYIKSPKGSVSLMRSTYETLVKEILISLSIHPAGNFKEQLIQLRDIDIIKEFDLHECSTCGYRKRDSELNFSYDLYSLLSHYGSHTGRVDDKTGNWIYTATSSHIWFLLSRYEMKISGS